MDFGGKSFSQRHEVHKDILNGMKFNRLLITKGTEYTEYFLTEARSSRSMEHELREFHRDEED